MRTALRLAGAAALACSSMACEPSDGVDALHLRPEVRVVAEFPTVSHACLVESGCPQYIWPTIVDVARDQDLLAVLYTWPRFNGEYYSANAGLVFSTDDGQTWSEPIVAPGGAGAGLEEIPYGLAIRDGILYTLTPYARHSGTGDWVDLILTRFDPATGATAGVSTLSTELVLDERDSLWSVDWFGSSPSFESSWYAWDVTTGAMVDGVSATYADPPGRVCGASVHWRGARTNGGSIRMFGGCLGSDGVYCQGETRLPGTDAWWPPFFRCVDTWPIPSGLGETHGPTGSVLYTDTSGGSPVTRAVRIVSRAGVNVTETHDVGPGSILYPVGDSASQAGVDRPRFGGLVALVEPLPDESTTVALHRATASGEWERTSLPTRPCNVGDYCGYLPTDPTNLILTRASSSLQWALPLRGSDDEWLIFYVLDTMRPSSGEHRNAMFMERVQLDRGPGVPAGPLELACARAAGCSHTLPLPMSECIGRWMQESVPESRRAAFIAATTCDALATLEPSLRFGERCTGEGYQCDGAIGLSCSGGTVSGTIDCGAVGSLCELGASGGVSCEPVGADCPTDTRSCDASGRAVYCDVAGVDDCAARGLMCVTDAAFGCFERVTPTCAGVSNAMACAGDRLVYCTDIGWQQPAVDCARIPGLSCDPEAQCIGDGACDPIDTEARCDGSSLRYCLYGSWRQLDCAGLGLSCGDDASGEAACVGTAPARVDAGMPMDAGPTCTSATLGGPVVSEAAIAEYPPRTGGTIVDGTYDLTTVEIWSSAVQPYTTQETLVFRGGRLESVTMHSALGFSTAAGSYTALGTALTWSQDCPFARPRDLQYSVTGAGLVLFDSSRISTYVRR